MFPRTKIYDLPFVAICLLAACTGEIRVYHDVESWKEARETCRKQKLESCDLITKERLQEEWTQLGLSGQESFWVGGQRFFRWLWDEGNGERFRLFHEHGCYSLTVAGNRMDQLLYNGPLQCYRVCVNSPFVYLQGDSCYCASQLEGEAVSRDNCDVTCDGSDDKCGAKSSSTYFSVYSIPEQIKFVDRDLSVGCAVGSIQNNQLYVESVDCTSYHHYFCEADKSASFISTRDEQYDRAASQCEILHDSTLLSLPSPSPQDVGQLLTDLRDLSDKMSAVLSLRFWLPLRRHVRAVWVDGTEGEEGGQFGDCLAAMPRSGSFRLSDHPCSQSFGAICACSRVTNPVDGGDKGSGDQKPGPNNTIIVVVIAVILVIIVAFSVIFVFMMKRRAAMQREQDFLQERFGHSDNPLFTVRGDFQPPVRMEEIKEKEEKKEEKTEEKEEKEKSEEKEEKEKTEE